MLLLSAAGIATTLALFGAYVHLKELEEGLCSGQHPPAEAERLLGKSANGPNDLHTSDSLTAKEDQWSQSEPQSSSAG
jgi:hypothetical protein